MQSDDSQPLVTVVVAAYNGERWIEQTLESVFGQTYPNLEIIVVDDGSTDGTVDLLQAHTPRLRLIRKANGGAAAARNAGARAASGKYLAFLDQDDLWYPEKVAVQIGALQSDAALSWSYTDAILFDSDTGRELGRASDRNRMHRGDVLIPLLMGNFIPFASIVVERNVLLDAGGFPEDEACAHIDDWDLWLRIAQTHRLEYTDTPLVRYRLHQDQATQTMDTNKALSNRIALVTRAVERDPARLSKHFLAARASAFISVARISLTRGRRADAVRLFVHALTDQPLSMRAGLLLLASLAPRPMRRLMGRFRRLLLPEDHGRRRVPSRFGTEA